MRWRYTGVLLATEILKDLRTDLPDLKKEQIDRCLSLVLDILQEATAK